MILALVLLLAPPQKVHVPLYTQTRAETIARLDCGMRYAYVLENISKETSNVTDNNRRHILAEEFLVVMGFKEIIDDDEDGYEWPWVHRVFCTDRIDKLEATYK